MRTETPPHGRRRWLVPVMSRHQRAVFALLMGGWIAALAFFWTWWLRPEHLVTPFGMVVNSAMFVWSLLLPGVFFAHLARMARTDPALPLPDLRVAIIVTKAPSEPWDVVRRTLRAMLRQEMPYAYDVWLADEAPTAETLRWCEANDVRVSTRRGRADYHAPAWPRRTKSKEGNLAFFYDHWGYRDYDVVAQLDADHRPAPTYLREVVRPFVDPEVGYVAAPSICDANAGACWAARGRLFKEAVFHGPQQAGGHHAIPPVCIGSHYAVRTQALREIGGIGPELAEDFSTSLIMNSFGWRGVFALDAEAHGDGPETFADFVTQEFQWARSLSDVTLHYNRRYWRGLDRRAKVKLGFGEAWYPLYALHMLAAALFPVVALVSGTPWADVGLLDFYVHSAVVGAVLLGILAWVRAQGWLRPADAPLVTWETALFLFTRWPWVLWGVVQSWAGKLLRRRFGFKVTPKGIDDATPIGLRAVVPYLAIAGVCGATAILAPHPGAAQGYYWFCLVNAATYLVVAIVVVALHLRESAVLTWSAATRLAAGPLAGIGAVGALVVVAVAMRGAVAAHTLIPPRVWDALDLARDVPPGAPAPPPGGAPLWLVLVTGLALVAGALLFALRAGDRTPRGDRAPLADAALFAVLGACGLVFVVLSELWWRTGSVSSFGFAAVIVVGAAVGGAAASRRQLVVGAEHAAAASVGAEATAAAAAALAPLPAEAPPVSDPPRPMPRRARARAGGPRFVREPMPAPVHVEAAVASAVVEIDWRPSADGLSFGARALTPAGAAPVDRSPAFAPAGDGAPARTDDASRAHALLCDRLALTGWEPYGHGDAWFAHRFRRAAAATAGLHSTIERQS